MYILEQLDNAYQDKILQVKKFVHLDANDSAEEFIFRGKII